MDRNVRTVLFVLGMGAVSALLVWAIVAGAFVPRQADADAGWIYNYQTLITGALAILAAMIGAWFIQSQIDQTWTIETQRRGRKHAALRAVMPLALARIGDYCRSCAEAILVLHSWCKGGVLSATGKTKPSLPEVPDDTISILSEFIEYSEPGEAALIEDLLREIQVQSGRLRTMMSDIGKGSGIITDALIEEFLIDTAIIYASGSAGLDYARGQTQSLPKGITWDEVATALRLLDVHDTQYPNVYKLVKKKAENSSGPRRFTVAPGSAG